MIDLKAFKTNSTKLAPLCNILRRNKITWSDFKVPSTLKLSLYLELLLEPIRDNESIEKVKLGLHEALVNAVKHGNAGDQNKELRVRRILTPNWLIWQIQDEGNGLSPERRNGSLPIQIDSESGRGLFLIHHTFDDVRWSNRGNRLQLAIRRNF